MCCSRGWIMLSFFFQAEDGIRDSSVTGGALPIWIVWQEEPHCHTIRPDASRRGRGEEQARWHSSRWRLWLAAIPLGSRHCLRFQTSQAIGAYGLVGPSFSCVRSPHACVPGRQEPRPDHIGDEAQEGLVSEEGPVVGLPVWFHRYLSRSNGFPGGPIAQYCELKAKRGKERTESSKSGIMSERKKRRNFLVYRLRQMDVDDKICEQIGPGVLEKIYPTEVIEQCVQGSNH